MNFVDDEYQFPGPDEEPTLIHPGHADVLDELGPGKHDYEFNLDRRTAWSFTIKPPPPGEVLEIGWFRLSTRKMKWHEELRFRIRYWWNRTRGNHTVVSWNIDDD